MQKIQTVPFNEPLGRINTAVMKEFTGEIPSMRTNLFAVFCFCTRVLLDVSKIADNDSGLFAHERPSAHLGFSVVDKWISSWMILSITLGMITRDVF